MAPKQRYLSGIQPSGMLHLGNYFGAIRSHVASQDDGFYFIADYHALTTTRDAETLRQLVFDAAADYLALGLDPQRAVLFRQSDVPEVTELTWLLMTTTGMGLLERAHSFKDKKARGITPTMGLFNYPVLMAADILIYDSHVVPVGPDQVQHLEMTRDMAQSFNAYYGDVFVLPKFELGTPELVPGLDGEKMSKSYGNAIPIFATGKALRKLVMSIKTDSTPLEDPKDPDSCTAFAIYRLFASPEEVAEMRENYARGGYGYGHAKVALLEQIETYFAEARERRVELQNNPDLVHDVLADGGVRARQAARRVLDRARAACGL
jgi:tryptophanyl-tRNA synthetase